MAIASVPVAEDVALVPFVPEDRAEHQGDEVVQEQYRSADRSLPWITLVQPIQASKEMPVGHFVRTTTGQDLGEEMLAVVLSMAQARVLYRGEYGSPDREAVCVSHDLATGFGSPGGECGTCPFAARSEIRDEDGTPKTVPAPRIIRHLYVVLPVRFADGIRDDAHLRAIEDAGPAVFRMQGVSRRNADFTQFLRQKR